VLVGPNDAGKSTVFRAIRLAAGDCKFDSPVDRALLGRDTPAWVQLKVIADSEADPAVRASAMALGFSPAPTMFAGVTRPAPAGGEPQYEGLPQGLSSTRASYDAGPQNPELPTAAVMPPVIGFDLFAEPSGDVRVTAVTPGSVTFPGPAKFAKPADVRRLLFAPCYVGEVVALPDSVEKAQLDVHAAITRALVASAGELDVLFSGDRRERVRVKKRIEDWFSDAVARTGFWKNPPVLRLEHEGEATLSLSLKFGAEGDVPPSNAGAGNNWMVAFAIWLHSQRNVPNRLFLIDEPGMHLDPRNQKRLRECLEKLSEMGQVIYSTHSPFLVPRSRPDRIIQVNYDRLTKRPQGADLGRVRAALGIVGADTFLFGSANLIVEGDSDRIYVERFAAAIGAFSEEVAVVSAGGAANVEPVARVLQSLETLLAVLFDADREGRRQANSLTRRLPTIDAKKVFHLVEDEKVQCAIEDLLDLRVLIQAVNNVHELMGEHLLDVDRFRVFRETEAPGPGAPAGALLGRPVVDALGAWVQKADPDATLLKPEIAVRYCELVKDEPPARIAELLRRIAVELIPPPIGT
jgi:energy-coupling factor transporter ATP-binding protein EcfA2